MKAEKRKWFLPKPFVITAAACLIVAAVFLTLACTVSAGMYDQKAAEVWQGFEPDAMPYSQVSVFIGRGAGLSYDKFGQLCYNIDEKFTTDSIASDSMPENARLWISAASTDGTVSAAHGGTSINVTATAVTGDFFQFHPLEMMSGSYLRADEPSKDIVLLDWNTAWRLFGGFEITDMELEIGGTRVIVGGVFRKDKDDTAEYRIYMSYEMYERINYSPELTVLEFVLPEPISQYGMTAVTDNLTTAVQNRVIVENTSRFKLKELYSAIINIRETIEHSKSIALPYWENSARVAVLRGAVFLMLAVVFAVLPAIALFWTIGKIYRMRAAFIPWVKRMPAAVKGKFSRKSKKETGRENVINGGENERIFNDDETIDGGAVDSGDATGDERVQAGGE